MMHAKTLNVFNNVLCQSEAKSRKPCSVSKRDDLHPDTISKMVITMALSLQSFYNKPFLQALLHDAFTTALAVGMSILQVHYSAEWFKI